MELFIEEIGTLPNSTASQLFINGKPFCFILEDGYRAVKVAGETRIDSGRYPVIRRTHGRIYEDYKARFKHRFAFEIAGVQNFMDILMHIGCFIVDTRGCPLIVSCIGVGDTGEYYGTNSTVMYKKFYKLLAAAFDRGEEVWVEISRRPIIDENTPVG